MQRAVTVVATVVLGMLALPLPLAAQSGSNAKITAQPNPGRYFVDPAKSQRMNRAELIRLLRSKVKYVFVVFNENHSFDNEFGTFPGANGLFSDGAGPRDAAHTPGFTQTYTGADGKQVSVTPFRIGPEQNSTFFECAGTNRQGVGGESPLR